MLQLTLKACEWEKMNDQAAIQKKFTDNPNRIRTEASVMQRPLVNRIRENKM